MTSGFIHNNKTENSRNFRGNYNNIEFILCAPYFSSFILIFHSNSSYIYQESGPSNASLSFSHYPFVYRGYMPKMCLLSPPTIFIPYCLIHPSRLVPTGSVKLS